MNRLLRAGPLLDQMQFVGSLPYPEFLVLLAECALAVSDSGGVQEEVSVLKRPMVVIRNSTERPGVIGVFAVLRQPGDLPTGCRPGVVA